MNALPEMVYDEAVDTQPELSPPSIYASFSVDNYEFAIPVNQIQEVVNEPLGYSPIPLTPDYVLGLFNLRGTVVPVVDLRKIFLPESSNSSDNNRKVTIIEYGELCLGLLFDSTGEVFNTATAELCPFEKNEDSLKSQIIQGVFKMGDGQRIVQILDVLELLKLEHIPNTRFSSNAASRRRAGVRKQCISFYVRDSLCALDINTVKEIFTFDKIENSVLSSKLCLGAIDIRGSTVPIIDFAYLLGYAPYEAVDDRELNVVVLQLGNNLFGLLVDSIDSIVNFFKDDLLDFPVIGSNKEDLFAGCIADDSGAANIIVLNESKLFSHDEILDITRGHSNLFQNSSGSDETESKKEFMRESLITFSLGNNYGVNIRDVKEIVDTPDKLLAPPDSSACIKGLFNLRGELITVVDSRKLCDENTVVTSATPDDTKVLVYESEGQKFGLMVDSVDAIVHYYEQETIEIPQLLKPSANTEFKAIGNAVDQAIVVGSETIGILDLDKITNSIVA